MKTCYEVIESQEKGRRSVEVVIEGACSEVSHLVEEFTNHRVRGFAPITKVLEEKNYMVIRYDIGSCRSLPEVLKKGISEEGLLELLLLLMGSIVNALQSNISVSKIVWEEEAIFLQLSQSEVRLLYDFGRVEEEHVLLKDFIIKILEQVKLLEVRYNVKKFLKSYLIFEPKLQETDFFLFLKNMRNHLFGEREYSGQLTLSSRLEEDSLQVDDFFCIRKPTGEQSTSFLQESVDRAYLFRERTKEKVLVAGEQFRIGKERFSVDYCIGQNMAVSRLHAVILLKNQRFFIQDMNSTNHTYVNDIEVKPGEEVELTKGAKICFANELFRFYTSSDRSIDY